MSWHAIDALDDARAATADLLLPFDLGTWLRLALVVVFVGTGASNASVNANVGGTATTGAPPVGPSMLPFEDLPPLDPGVLPAPRTLAAAAVAFLAVALLAALAFSFVGSVMEFVLVTGLVERSVRIRGPFGDHLGAGARLFAFRLLVVACALLVVGVPAALVVLGGVAVGPGLLLAALPLLLLGVALALVVALLFRLTVDFVVPTMLAAECGVLDGWRRFWPTLRGAWEEFALYVVVRVSLGVLVGALFAAGSLFVAVLVALPFVLVGGAVALAFSAAGGLPLVGWALLGVVGLLYLAAVAAGSALLLVPVVTFLRYYALSVLGRADEGLDLLGVSSGDAEDGANGPATA